MLLFVRNEGSFVLRRCMDHRTPRFGTSWARLALAGLKTSDFSSELVIPPLARAVHET